MALDKITGVVISKMNYSDHDEIVNLITQRGKISIIALGTRKPNSKNSLNLQLYSIVEAEIFFAKFVGKMSKLKKSIALHNFDFHQSNNLRLVPYLEMIFDNSEKINKIFLEKYIYFLNSVEKHYDAKLITWLLANSPLFDSYKQHHDHCVVCSSNQMLQDFEFTEGGMLCEKHAKKQKNTQLLMAYYYLFSDVHKYIKNSNYQINIEIFKHLMAYLNDCGFYC